MSKVQRYDCELGGNECNESFALMELNEEGGEWVSYGDYKKVFSSRERLKEVLKDLRTELYLIKIMHNMAKDCPNECG